ncbi:DUF1963 domain-containing protein [Nonomuraea sp. NPDC049480]|uniref:DUF1963 domain-containing protein n=1 Tax=Nonomuraea sp. NPDC049480 TaxID=3364353 RepID=UPI0037A87346
MGSQLVDLAKPGFVLEPADKDFQTGRCRAGGDIAFLEQGTPWPQDQQGRPLSVLAVLDTNELAPWLGDELPTRLGLVNIFALHPEHRAADDCQIVTADPARAVGTPSPPAAPAFNDHVLLGADPIVTLPAMSGDRGDPILETLDFRDEPGYDTDSPYTPDHIRFVMEPFGGAWEAYCEEAFGFQLGEAQAFGWPHIHQGISDRAKGYSHLATISNLLWGGDGLTRVMVPTEALRTGKFTNVEHESDSHY